MEVLRSPNRPVTKVLAARIIELNERSGQLAGTEEQPGVQDRNRGVRGKDERESL